MVTSTQKRPQMAMGEETLDDPTGELERLLDERAMAKEERRAPMRNYNAKHTLAKEAVAKIVTERELTEGDYRLGEHIVTVSHSEPRKVEFERASKTSIRFKIAKP